MDTSQKLVTLDTNLYDDQVLIEIGKSLPYIDMYVTKVSEEELGKSVVVGWHLVGVGWGSHGWDEAFWGEQVAAPSPNGALPKLFTLNESMLNGEDVLAPDWVSTSLMQDILKIATHGSTRYPQDLDSTSKGKINNLQDARILQIHTAHKGDILVSDDVAFFIGKTSPQKGPHRQALEELCSTRIMTSREFKDEFMTHIRPGSYIHDMYAKQKAELEALL